MSGKKKKNGKNTATTYVITVRFRAIAVVKSVGPTLAPPFYVLACTSVWGTGGVMVITTHLKCSRL